MSDEIEVTGVGPRSPHNEGLYEAGKALMVESIHVGRDFCKSMIGVATSAIPIYVGLVGLVVGGDFRPSAGEGAVLTLAPAALLAAATAFAIGYFPKGTAFSLDLPSEIDAARTATLAKRLRWSYVGFGLLLLGITLAVVGVFYALTLSDG